MQRDVSLSLSLYIYIHTAETSAETPQQISHEHLKLWTSTSGCGDPPQVSQTTSAETLLGHFWASGAPGPSREADRRRPPGGDPVAREQL